MNLNYLFLILFIYLIGGPCKANSTRQIKWEKYVVNEGRKSLSFDEAVYLDDFKNLPVYFEKIPLFMDVANPKISLINPQFENALDSLIADELIDLLSHEITISSKIVYERKKVFLIVSFVPLRFQPESKKLERLLSFDFDIQFEPKLDIKKEVFKNSGNSILYAGTWSKIKLQQEGVYKIDYNFLQDLGLNPAQIDPRNLRIYGNGGGMLPEKNADTQYDDPMENAILVVGEEDGSFDPEDYILFYGQSPHQWTYNEASHRFSHSFNVYSDYTYYFITASLGTGKRIQQQMTSLSTPTQTITSFIDHQFHELDERNLINSGRTWYGEIFDLSLSQNFDFSFPHIEIERQAIINIDFAARSSVSSRFDLFINEVDEGRMSVSGINFFSSYPPFARAKSSSFNFLPDQDELKVKLEYIKPNSSSLAWLNYIELIAWRSLIFDGGQLSFRTVDFVNVSEILNYEIDLQTDAAFLWDVSDPLNVKNQEFQKNVNELSFVQDALSLKEYILFDDQSFLIPEDDGMLSNQNYHAIPVSDLIIISPSEFRSQAERLANFHADHDGLTYCIVEPRKLYNEFSSGAPDISAIRNFVKHQYDKANEGEEPLYLLLFGDASFDYKNKIPGNNNFVSTWESINGVDIGTSYMSDDYFGLLDDNEGAHLNAALDIGIGRLPVSSLEEARVVVDKILHYSGNDPDVFGSWRNKVCLIGDDQDYNTYVSDSESIANIIENLCPTVNIDKIYFDAYPQESTPGGERYPAVNEAINQSVEKGVLVVNYIGHGGETGWAHERVLELEDINAWSNYDKLAVFITATCEFTRLDDPERKSAGEFVLTNPNGGGIALFTTTRATSSGGNFQLNKNVINFMFKPTVNHENRLGDVVCASKNAIGNTVNSQKFVLVGDPALRMAIPQDSLAILKINNQNIEIETDTLNALAQVSIEGSVYDFDGNKRTDYNGILYPMVFDKKSKIKTLAQDNDSFEQEFSLMNNILYKGKSSIVNGDFSFSFVVPKDITYNYDFGKISLYASDDVSDACGYYNNLVIGGYDEEAENDISGPEILLYMNDVGFSSGDEVNPNSTLLAYLSDVSGINTVGNGIGHDIVAVLDEQTSVSYVLNDFYEAELDDFTSGKIEYPFSNLENGIHSLELKAWDVHNNSSTTSIEFIITASDELSIQQLMNFPNPFINETHFQFELNQDHTLLQIEIQIFNLNGKKVRSITKTNYGSKNIVWSGDSDNGAKLSAGIYVYRLIVKKDNGEQAQKMEKLLIIR